MLGVPFGVAYPTPGPAAGCAEAPAAIRARSQHLARFAAHHDFDLDGPMLPPGTSYRAADAGDVPGSAEDGAGNTEATEAVVRQLLGVGAVPLLLGGDDSVPIPLLRAYADHGGTVLLSSHLLAEVEIIADDIVMIGQGRVVCQGSKAELLQAAGTVVRAADAAALQRALAAAGIVSTVSEDGSVRTNADTAPVGRAAYDGGVVLTALRNAASGGLEDMFLELTADTQRERTAA